VASIPGPMFLIVGLIVSIFSFFLNEKSFGFIGAYSLFLYFGLIILLYGFVKTLIWFMMRKSPEEKKIEAANQQNNSGLAGNQQNNPMQAVQSQNQQGNLNQQTGGASQQRNINQPLQGVQQAKVARQSAFDEVQKNDFDEDRYRVVIRCQNCGMPHYIYSNFCSNCGAHLPKQ
jgi:hypothetical protein